MEDYTVSLDPETEMVCTLYLFKDVQNSNELHKKVMDNKLSCCIIKAALIVDPLQVIVAANKAAISAKMTQLTTKTLYTEVLFNLSVSKNISRSLADFGIGYNDKNILIAIIHKECDGNSMSEILMNSIKGERVLISSLPQFTNFDLVKRRYKIDENELNISTLANSVISRISCKDY
ncbi:EKC/KEOPS complex subunit TPRKB-like isoform X1 [Bombus huntii]|uniref:EKC/KEOPS complex subunit TPRKB-like isoform X1 n=1 Tax=Bombus huntii TaxID=85661 RepID=UPI0021AAC441|nr:EKC/KEOPS complex subunit TPRKB-like isoform X1 [Bombus huntii]XP_050470955.1 EKC/KEOPS complex subunit TPRKB-like isoform X1 [Bombus huntii]XP_050470956.1 EKC/KEOPS complex subunit TPRKB-like isoform X1 [Bombus huntii]